MKRFLPALVLALAVIVAAPFMGLVRDALFDRFPRQGVLYLGVVLAATGGALFLWAVIRIRRHRLARYGGLLAVGALLVIQARGFETGMAQVNVVEKVHIFEYGLLAFLLYRAWRPAGDLSLVILPLLWTAFAGTLEEWMQWLVETRTGEVRDVLLNALAGVCGVVFSFSLAPPERFVWRLPPAARRRVGDAAALTVLALGGFFYTAHLGYLNFDPEIGRFRSFYTLDGLHRAAAERAERWAREPPSELSPWHREDFYLTEAGWHTMYRNACFGQEQYGEARQSNRLLEKYFAPYLDLKTFRQTGDRRFPPHALAQLATAPPVDPERWESPSGVGRIYVWPPKPLFVAFVLALAAAIWTASRLLARQG